MASPEAKPWSPPKTYADVWDRYWERVKGQVSYQDARQLHLKWKKLGSSV